MFNLATQYSQVFDDSKAKASILLVMMELYVNGAIIQEQRFRAAYKKPNSSKLNLDIHFYLICIGMVKKIFTRLKNLLTNKKVDDLYLEYNKLHNNAIRNHYEHMDEKIANNVMKGGFFNLNYDNLIFNGKSYPIKTDGLADIYKKLIKIIKTEYALKNECYRFRRRSDRTLKKLIKVLKV